MKRSIIPFFILFTSLVLNAQDLKGLEAETKFLMAVESGNADIFGRWEFPRSRDSSCDFIIQFREQSASWMCYTPPSVEFCKSLEASGRFNTIIPVNQMEFLSDYQKNLDNSSAYCFTL